MNTVRVMYFAAVRDLVGKSEEEVDIPSSVRKLEDLVRFLTELHPALAGRLTGVRFAVNEQFAEAFDPIEPGDVIAVIPPVAGG